MASKPQIIATVIACESLFIGGVKTFSFFFAEFFITVSDICHFHWLNLHILMRKRKERTEISFGIYQIL